MSIAALALMAVAASAQVVGDPAPVPPRQGLLGTYYSYPVNSPTPPGSVPGSPDNTPPTQAGALQIAQRIDGPLNINFQGNAPPGNAGSSDWFMVVWEGFIVIPAAGNYAFHVSSDDGERSWFGNVTAATPNLDFWNQRGVVQDNLAAQALAVGNLPVRVEFEQGNGGVSILLEWSGQPGAEAPIPAANLIPPAGPAAPTLTASSPPGPPPPQVSLSWTAPAGATAYILSRQVGAGAMQVYQLLTGNTFVDTNVVFGTQYSYIVQATSTTGLLIGPASTTQTVTPILPAITASPITGLQTNENAATATITIMLNQVLTGGNSITFTVTSNDATEGLVSGGGQPMGSVITFTVNGPQVLGATIPITVTGVDDFVADPATAYTVSITATSTLGAFNGVAIPNIQLTNNDNDTPGITVSPTGGVWTSESAGTATFTVVLNTQPTGTVTMNLTSSNTAEGTVGPAALTFNTTAGGPNGWNTAHVVTVTGVDDALLDFAVAYTIVTGNLASSDPNYNGINPPDVSCANLDNEAIPEPPHVWGSGGCGLLGLEIALLVGLAALRRRRNS